MKAWMLVVVFALAGNAAATTPADNAQLGRLLQQDQADRDGEKIDWKQVTARDQGRRNLVKTMLAAGEVRTAVDYYNAAMIYQHGESLADYRLANALATLAMQLAPDDSHYRWLAAASWDRLLAHQLQPQWYATQFNGDAKGMYLFPVAADAVSDAERKAMTGHTLAESRAHVAVAAKKMDMPVRDPAPTLAELRSGTTVDEDR